MNNEGYIKFECKWKQNKISIPENVIERIAYWKKKFQMINLIGTYPNGISYGNISIRKDLFSFFITGTQTGNIDIVDSSVISLVTNCYVEKNIVHCEGEIKASSEAMSHYSIYKSNDQINAVIHVHDSRLWKKLSLRFPTTSKIAEFGTIALSNEIAQISKKLPSNIVITLGHEDGIFVFDKNIDKAGNHLLLNI